MSVDRAVERGVEFYTPAATNTEAEQAYIDRTMLAGEITKMRTAYAELYTSMITEAPTVDLTNDVRLLRVGEQTWINPRNVTAVRAGANPDRSYVYFGGTSEMVNQPPETLVAMLQGGDQ